MIHPRSSNPMLLKPPLRFQSRSADLLLSFTALHSLGPSCRVLCAGYRPPASNGWRDSRCWRLGSLGLVGTRLGVSLGSDTEGSKLRTGMKRHKPHTRPRSRRAFGLVPKLVDLAARWPPIFAAEWRVPFLIFSTHILVTGALVLCCV